MGKVNHTKWAARALRVLLPALRGAPLGLLRRIGAALGAWFGSLPIRDVRRCQEHLARAYPEWSSAQLRRMTRRCFSHFGKQGFSIIALSASPSEHLARRVVVLGRASIRAALRDARARRGTVFIGGHFGNWELSGRLLGSFNATGVIGKRLRDPDLDALVRDVVRQGGTGCRLIYQDQGMIPCLRALRAGEWLGFVADQDIARFAGVFCPYFGELAYTPSGPAAIALKTGAPVIPLFVYEVAGRYVFHAGPRRVFTPSGDAQRDAQRVMSWVTAVQERLVRRYPEQWVWWHRRWRTRPEDKNSSAAAEWARIEEFSERD